MQDLNDLYFFAQVVEHSGFAAAARALGMPRSRLSGRIGLLEQRLGIRLIQRSTSRFAVTEIGHAYHRHCVAMLVEAEAAQETIDQVRAVPQGLVRVSCPTLCSMAGPAPCWPGSWPKTRRWSCTWRARTGVWT
jgi:DNA-binding transcriptional LysR family regulator